MNSDLLELKIVGTAEPHRQIEQHIRQQIQSGKLSDGEKFPPSNALARRWGVSCTAVQKAMNHLSADGLIERKPKRGTFAKAATEKAVIGVLFGPSLTDETAHFYRAILAAIRDEMQDHHLDFRTYDAMTGRKGLPLPPDSKIYQHFVKDLQRHSFKGLIEFSPGVQGLGAWEQEISLPKVRYELPPAPADVRIDRARFLSESVGFLARNGRRRILYFHTGWHLAPQSADLDGLFDAVRELSLPQAQIESLMTTEQGVRMERAVFRKAQQMIAQWKNGQRPDGLIVGDDIAMRAVALALVKAGIQVPEDLLVVSLANEGVDLHYGIPVVRYEFSPREIGKKLLDLLWKRILGEALPPLPMIIRGQIKEEKEEVVV